jgi:hypothetical protein
MACGCVRRSGVKPQSRAILATEPVVEYPETARLLESANVHAQPQRMELRGITEEVKIYEIP